MQVSIGWQLIGVGHRVSAQLCSATGPAGTPAPPATSHRRQRTPRRHRRAADTAGFASGPRRHPAQRLGLGVLAHRPRWVQRGGRPRRCPRRIRELRRAPRPGAGLAWPGPTPVAGDHRPTRTTTPTPVTGPPWRHGGPAPSRRSRPQASRSPRRDRRGRRTSRHFSSAISPPPTISKPVSTRHSPLVPTSPSPSPPTVSPDSTRASPRYRGAVLWKR